MIIYIDVLIAVNIIVDYFLIILTAKVLGEKIKTARSIFAAVFGGFSSLYIFIPHVSILIDALIKLFISLIITLIAFGVKSIKRYIRITFVMYAISFCYAGAILALNNVINLRNVIVYNSVVYYDISPIALIVLTVVFYLLVIMLKNLLRRKNKLVKECVVEISFNGSQREFRAIFDTGNSLRDVFSENEVIIIDFKAANDLLKAKPSDFPNAYRLIPLSTVSGRSLLEAVRCDSAKIKLNDKSLVINSPILAISKYKLNTEYPVLLNPDILLTMEA